MISLIEPNEYWITDCLIDFTTQQKQKNRNIYYLKFGFLQNITKYNLKSIPINFAVVFQLIFLDFD